MQKYARKRSRGSVPDEDSSRISSVLCSVDLAVDVEATVLRNMVIYVALRGLARVVTACCSIGALGGAVSRRFRPSCTHALADYADDVPEGCVGVSPFWLAAVARQGRVPDPSPLYEPVRRADGVEGGDGVCVAVRGFGPDAQAEVEAQVELAGLELRSLDGCDALPRGVTHVVLAAPVGKWYDAAVEAGACVARAAWVAATLAGGRVADDRGGPLVWRGPSEDGPAFARALRKRARFALHGSGAVRHPLEGTVVSIVRATPPPAPSDRRQAVAVGLAPDARMALVRRAAACSIDIVAAVSDSVRLVFAASDRPPFAAALLCAMARGASVLQPAALRPDGSLDEACVWPDLDAAASRWRGASRPLSNTSVYISARLHPVIAQLVLHADGIPICLKTSDATDDPKLLVPSNQAAASSLLLAHDSTEPIVQQLLRRNVIGVTPHYLEALIISKPTPRKYSLS